MGMREQMVAAVFVAAAALAAESEIHIRVGHIRPAADLAAVTGRAAGR